MKALKITITKFISNYQPGIVECKFHDAWNKEFIIHEKVPVVTLNDLYEDSKYPQDGIVACEIIREWNDKDGRVIIKITTEKPWGVETIDRLTEFEVLEEQLIEHYN
jgi:hypothetical protein